MMSGTSLEDSAGGLQDSDDDDTGSEPKRQRLSSHTTPGSSSMELIDKPGVTADIWKHFKVLASNLKKAVCLYCGAKMGCHRNTSHMRTHYASCQSKEIAKQRREGVISLLDQKDAGKSKLPGQQSMLNFVTAAPSFATECTK